MPNIIFLGLVIVVFYHSITEGVKTAVSRCLEMTFGGIIAGITGVIFSVIFLGLEKTLADILWLAGSTGDSESKHNIFDMVAQVAIGAMDGARQWVKYGVIIGVVIILCLVIKKILKKDTQSLSRFLKDLFKKDEKIFRCFRHRFRQ